MYDMNDVRRWLERSRVDPAVAWCPRRSHCRSAFPYLPMWRISANPGRSAIAPGFAGSIPAPSVGRRNPSASQHSKPTGVDRQHEPGREGGVDPVSATMRLGEYGHAVMTLALRGLERKTLDIGEVSGVRAGDIDARTWLWTVRRQTTPGPGGLIDKGTKGKRARTVPLIEEIRPMVGERLRLATSASSRLFVGPKGGRITTAVLRDASRAQTSHRRRSTFSETVRSAGRTSEKH